jgi:SAM-dependent methyltransferase
MAHREVYEVLRQILVTEAPDRFIFLDVACGTAETSAVALEGANVGRYIGIDISQPSLEMARKALTNLRCPVDLRREDFVVAINAGPNRSTSYGLANRFITSAPMRNRNFIGAFVRCCPVMGCS